MSLCGKVALITGGLGGIGFQTARELLKNNAKGVALADINTKNAKHLLFLLCKEFGKDKAIFIPTDVTKTESFKKAFDKTRSTFSCLDILFNNAGIRVEGLYEGMMKVNLNAVIKGTLMAMETYMPDGGAVINNSSVHGIDIINSVPIFSGFKSAVIAFGRNVGSKAHFSKSKVKVFTVVPGATKTEFLKQGPGRYLDAMEKITPQNPEDLAKHIVQILEHGKNGSVWVSENDELYEIEMPKRSTLRTPAPKPPEPPCESECPPELALNPCS